MKRGATLADALADPHYHLHRIDPAQDEVAFVPTTAGRLAGPSFIDGRTDFAEGPPLVFPLSEALAAAPTPAAEPDRFIFHVSFCGSTLLARLLEVSGQSFMLKEPNALVDIADWKRATDADRRLGPALNLARSCFRRRWSTGETVAVKPSNWANNLLEELTADPATIRPLFITMARRPFLTAILRGGRDRLAFTARAAAHLAPSVDGGDALLRSAVAAASDPLGKAVHLALAALHIQTRLFAEAMKRGGWGQRHLLDAETIIANPAAAAQAANAVLGLGIDSAALAASAAKRAGENAKAPGATFSLDERRGEDDAVERHHGPTIDAALCWGEREFGSSDPLPAPQAPL